jgi:unsaturated chondroitin disaccharide hydrolase
MKTFEAEMGIGKVGSLSTNDVLRRAFDVCVRKTRRNIKNLADAPKAWAFADDGDYSRHREGFFEIGNWTSSFFTGMALLAWQQREDEYFLQQTLRLAPVYWSKATLRYLDMHHDAGFLYTLYSVALYKLTSGREHRDAGLAAATALLQRFNHSGGYIRAWGRLDEPAGILLDGRRTDNMAIIDCMMNLPLLFWASLESGDQKYHDAAVRQADTTLKCFVRADHSVCHAYRFDLQTGAPLGPDNICGYGVDSHWARGTAWAIYGFALAYKYTRDGRYLATAEQLALKFLSLLDQEVVPVWDFKLPPGKPPVRDASALAIAICGFKELAQQGGQDSRFCHATRPLLLGLCSDAYLDFDDNCRGVLKSAYGDKAAYSSWGDYFLMEALARELFEFGGYW